VYDEETYTLHRVSNGYSAPFHSSDSFHLDMHFYKRLYARFRFIKSLVLPGNGHKNSYPKRSAILNGDQ